MAASVHKFDSEGAGASTSINIPAPSFVTGVDVEERTFIWKIENFPVIIKNDSIINSQTIDFLAGESIGLSSTWTAYLETGSGDTEDGEPNRWIGILFKIKERPVTKSKQLYAKCSFAIKNHKGKNSWGAETMIEDMFQYKTIFGFHRMIDRRSEVPLVEENLIIQINFKIYSEPKSTQSVETMLESFHFKSAVKARKDFTELAQNQNVASNDIKITSNDGKEFIAQKGVLAARSPVFGAMLQTDMTEGNGGAISLPDISSTAFQVLLHFINTGQLLPEWRQGEILLELLNAAAKYQLSDLLNFLGVILGKVCDLQNVGALAILANHLGLKRAEEELLIFVRKNALSSTEKFLEMLSGVEALVERGGDEIGHTEGELTNAAGQGQGTKRSPNPDGGDHI